MRMGYFAAVSAAALSLIGAAASVWAQNRPPTPEEQAKVAIETRQGLFKLINFNMAPLAGMLKNQPFDAAVVQKNATRIEQLAAMIPDVFQADTSSFTGIKTRARSAVWNSKEDFNVKARELASSAAALANIAKSGEKDSTLKAVRTMAKACGSCHDDYRDKD
jgi:cytochrome c556